ncbi:MAG: hypothetical protein ACRCX8_19650 [Sarcina sp.]
MNLMKEAHKLTREIIIGYPNVNYQAQLGICISYLAKEAAQTQTDLEKRLDKALDEIEERLNVYPRKNKWEKGEYSRIYYSYSIYSAKGKRTDIKCGYLDLVKNEYVAWDRYCECVNLLA